MAGQAEFQERIERIRATRGEYKPAYDPADYLAKPARKAKKDGGKPGGLSRLNKMMALLLLLGGAAWGGFTMLPQAQPRIAALIGHEQGAADGGPEAVASATETPARPAASRGEDPGSGFRVLTSRTGLAD